MMFWERVTDVPIFGSKVTAHIGEFRVESHGLQDAEKSRFALLCFGYSLCSALLIITLQLQRMQV